MVVRGPGEQEILELGYGTLYERAILNKMLKRIVEEHGILSILEYPSNDMLGDPSALYEGIKADIRRSRELPRGKHDLVWCFCELERAEDPLGLLREMVAASGGYVLLVGQNIFNPGIALHKVYHLLRGVEWDHGEPGRMRLGYAIRLARALGLRVLEWGYFDIPFFILDLYEAASFLRAGISERMGSNIRESPFEKMNKRVKSLLAHHWYLLCARGGEP